MKISKEDFISAINDVEKCWNYEVNLNDFFKKNDVDGYIFQQNCCDTVLRLLSILFNDTKTDWISYFCFDLNFGRKWKEGTITDEHGAEIRLANAEDLYNLVVNN